MDVNLNYDLLLHRMAFTMLEKFYSYTLLISRTERKRYECDSPEAQRDRNAGERSVHDLRELESEHRPRIHPGSHAHLLQHQDLPGHQVKYKSSRHFINDS